jgi:hypothetical protein
MALRIRRGTNGERLSITPLEGELVYTTDTKNLYVGDGTTVGGNVVTGSGGGISELLEDPSPQLGGNLDLNGNQINGTGSLLILGQIVAASYLEGNEARIIYDGSQQSLITLTGTSANLTANSTIDIKSSKGTVASPLANTAFDNIGRIRWYGHDGSNYVSSASLRVTVAGNPTNGVVPSNIFLSATSTSGITRLWAFSGTTGQLACPGDIVATGSITSASGSVTADAFVGDLKGSVFGDDSSILVDAVNNIISAPTLVGDLNGNVNGSVFDVNSNLMVDAVNNIISANEFVGDLKGSVFGDDSTILVDAVNNTIPGYVSISDLKTALQDGIQDFVSFKAWILANL